MIGVSGRPRLSIATQEGDITLNAMRSTARAGSPSWWIAEATALRIASAGTLGADAVVVGRVTLANDAADDPAVLQHAGFDRRGTKIKTKRKHLILWQGRLRPCSSFAERDRGEPPVLRPHENIYFGCVELHRIFGVEIASRRVTVGAIGPLRVERAGFVGPLVRVGTEESPVGPGSDSPALAQRGGSCRNTPGSC